MGIVIVLNNDYSFLNVVTPKKAFSYISRGKVIVEKYTDNFMSTFYNALKIPMVIRFVYMIRQVYKRRVPWSKRNVMIRDNYTCAYCGIKMKNMTVDHVVPKVLGGKNTFENTVCACKVCNNKKGNKLPIDCGMYPKHRLIHPTITEIK